MWFTPFTMLRDYQFINWRLEESEIDAKYCGLCRGGRYRESKEHNNLEPSLSWCILELWSFLPVGPKDTVTPPRWRPIGWRSTTCLPLFEATLTADSS